MDKVTIKPDVAGAVRFSEAMAELAALANAKREEEKK